jgi:hypothetical protein
MGLPTADLRTALPVPALSGHSDEELSLAEPGEPTLLGRKRIHFISQFAALREPDALPAQSRPTAERFDRSRYRAAGAKPTPESAA